MTQVESASALLAELPATAEEEDTYNGPRTDGEYSRLRTQHEMMKTSMGGKLVLAPIDAQKPDLRVLDSATGDGYWLVDVACTLPPTATLVGTDLAPRHFLSELPANVSLTTHSILNPWPPAFRAAFDLVHQRFVLAVLSAEAGRDTTEKLFACVRPGGWIQMQDADVTVIREGPEYPVMTRFRDFMAKTWAIFGQNLAPGPSLAGWLTDAGAVDVQETIVMGRAGPAAECEVQGKRGTAVLLALLDGVTGMASSEFCKPVYGSYFVLTRCNSNTRLLFDAAGFQGIEAGSGGRAQDRGKHLANSRRMGA